jgi:hypothetical protein
MPKTSLSAPLLKSRIENKAYAYGVSPVVSSLLAEYVIDLLRELTSSSYVRTEIRQVVR